MINAPTNPAVRTQREKLIDMVPPYILDCPDNVFSHTMWDEPHGVSPDSGHCHYPPGAYGL
jgi:hypothetical protein